MYGHTLKPPKYDIILFCQKSYENVNFKLNALYKRAAPCIYVYYWAKLQPFAV